MKNIEKTAVILMSGGMDSAVCAAIAKTEGYEIAALHINYGQRTETREYQSFVSLSTIYKIKHKLSVDVSYFSQIGGSSLTSTDIEIESADFDRKVIPASYVPFRNANIISIGISWAEVIGAEALFIGANQLDSSGYPDCTRQFLDAFQSAIDSGTKPETNIKLIAPLLDMTKKDIVLTGAGLGVPFELTWSCYSDNALACGVCDSCALRLRGFHQAGIEDPIPYSIKPNYK